MVRLNKEEVLLPNYRPIKIELSHPLSLQEKDIIFGLNEIFPKSDFFKPLEIKDLERIIEVIAGMLKEYI